MSDDLNWLHVFGKVVVNLLDFPFESLHGAVMDTAQSCVENRMDDFKLKVF